MRLKVQKETPFTNHILVKMTSQAICWVMAWSSKLVVPTFAIFYWHEGKRETSSTVGNSDFLWYTRIVDNIHDDNVTPVQHLIKDYPKKIVKLSAHSLTVVISPPLLEDLVGSRPCGDVEYRAFINAYGVDIKSYFENYHGSVIGLSVDWGAKSKHLRILSRGRSALRFILESLVAAALSAVVHSHSCVAVSTPSLLASCRVLFICTWFI